MPRSQRFPNARPPRRPHARLALMGAAGALAALLVLPAAAPRGTVLELEGQRTAPAAIGQVPTPSGRTPSPAPAVRTPSPAPAVRTPAPTTPATPAVLAVPMASPAPAPGAGIALRPAVMGTGIPPSRLWAEMTGTKAPSIDLLTGYRWPLAHPRLTLPFGPTVWGSRLVRGERFHDGVDLATFCGDRITAAHSGKVIAAGRRYDEVMGWIGSLRPYQRRLDRSGLWMTLPILVVTDDGNGYRSMYAHFGRIVVRKGQQVRAGQLLGYEGATGRASGCHLHYGLFSPWEMATFRIRPDVVKRMKLPKLEIARVDPLLVLPPKRGINAPRTSKPKQSASPAP